MKDKTLIYWDVGGVLLELNYGGLYQKGADLTNTTFEGFKKTYLNSNLEIDSLSGKISDADYQTRLKAMLGNPDMTREELEDFVKSGWGTEMTDVVDLKERAHFQGGVGTGIFSNNNDFAYNYLSRTYPRMLQTFDPRDLVVSSHIVGATKPDLKMYQSGERKAKIAGYNKVILIEDKPKYLEPGINQFGWYGIHLTINQDPQEAIKAEVGHTGEVEELDNLYVANSVEELEDTLKQLGVRL
ncbi:hypothetical protein GOV12_01055 [Candidatus Pacearchaeota archaeon]|nr:hypothetical protein [Candidatus Pacearchaeota archaeon]